MKYVYLSLFLIVTILHLYGTKNNNRLFRAATKGMILITVMGFYASSIENPSWLIILALLTSWAGDMLLIPNGTKYFVIGGISFMISHAFFVAGYIEISDLSKVPVVYFIVLGLIFAITVAIVFKRLTQYLLKALVAPMFLYLLINGTMNCFAIFRFISNPCLSTAITAVGALLFFISDTALFFVRFNKDSVQKSHFLVMVTYSLGEFLIVLGLV